jgi:hypothetical protein
MTTAADITAAMSVVDANDAFASAAAELRSKLDRGGFDNDPHPDAYATAMWEIVNAHRKRMSKLATMEDGIVTPEEKG